MKLSIQKRVLQDKIRKRRVEEKRSNLGRRWTGNFLFTVRHSVSLHSSYWVNASSHLSRMPMFFYISFVLTPFRIDFSNNWNRFNGYSLDIRRRPLNLNLVMEIKTLDIWLPQKSSRDENPSLVLNFSSIFVWNLFDDSFKHVFFQIQAHLLLNFSSQ